MASAGLRPADAAHELETRPSRTRVTSQRARRAHSTAATAATTRSRSASAPSPLRFFEESTRRNDVTRRMAAHTTRRASVPTKRPAHARRRRRQPVDAAARSQLGARSASPVSAPIEQSRRCDSKNTRRGDITRRTAAHATRPARASTERPAHGKSGRRHSVDTTARSRLSARSALPVSALIEPSRQVRQAEAHRCHLLHGGARACRRNDRRTHDEVGGARSARRLARQEAEKPHPGSPGSAPPPPAGNPHPVLTPNTVHRAPVGQGPAGSWLVGHSPWVLVFGFRSRVAGPNVVSIHEEGGTAGRPTELCFLWLGATHQKTHIENSESHKRNKKVTAHVRYPTKDSARGAQCAARRSPTQKLPPNTSLYFYIFLGKARCPRQRESIYRRGGGGMTTPAWCCRRRWRAPKPKSMTSKKKNDATLSDHKLETDRPARTFQAVTLLSGTRSAK